MWSKKVQDIEAIPQMKEEQSFVKVYLCGDKMYRIPRACLAQLANDYELVHCAEYLNYEGRLKNLFV